MASEDTESRGRALFEAEAERKEQRIDAASKQLRECPFCASDEVQIQTNRDADFIGFCCDCYAQGPPCEYLENAVTAWNHREAQRPRLHSPFAAPPPLKSKLVPAA